MRNKVKKKVVIITECRRWTCNYGETLQAVALNRYISKLGYNTYTVHYQYCKDANNRALYEEDFENYISKVLRFEFFRKKYMKNSVVRTGDKNYIEKLLDDTSVVICGSDCIWYEKDYNEVFCLYFPEKKLRKISYAPSLRDNKIDNIKQYSANIQKWTKGIDFLSCREEDGSHIIENITGRKCETVLDPTFLLSKDEWASMSSRRRVKESYIFVYILGRSMRIAKILDQISHHYPDRKIVWVRNSNNNGYNLGEVMEKVGPAQFLSLVRYADLVLTDSFHGTAFSLIFNKQVVAIKRVVSRKDTYENDSRIKNIFKKLKINNYYDVDENIDFNDLYIDYSTVAPVLNEEINNSKYFMEKALMNLKE